MSKPYAIFGAGLSARAAARLAQAKGLQVVLIDEAGRGDRSDFSAADLEEFSACIFSPGFAAAHPWRRLVASSGLPCCSEIAFAARYWQGRILGITGTNGKSSLTALLAQALQRKGERAVAAGNIGYSLSEAVLSAANQPQAYAVLEISSFQAELPAGLELDALLWTNFAEDHLDRYAAMADYWDAKARLLRTVKKGGHCVIGAQLAQQMAASGEKLKKCRIAGKTAPALPLSRDCVFARSPYAENFSLAAELWQLLGNPPRALMEAAEAFTLAPHRLSVVAEYGGVRFWNDSKATNFHATLAALEAVETPIFWIGGGRVKGGDLQAFARKVAAGVEAAFLYGEVGDALAEALEGMLDAVHIHPHFEDAVRAAAELAASCPPANVLLSPGFASFDQFASYKKRGKSFTDTVLGLKRTHKHN